MSTAATMPVPAGAHAQTASLRLSRNAYLALALGSVLYVFAIWYEVYVDTRAVTESEPDAFLQSHRQWRLRTAFLFLLWTILAGFCVPFGFGAAVFIPAYGWFLYRLSKGLIRFHRRGVI